MADAGISDGQLTTIVTIIGTGLAALGVAIRWSAGIIRDAFKETRDAQAATRAEMTQVIRDNTTAFAKFTEWLGRVDVRTEETTRRVVEVHKEISGVHEAPTADAIAAARGSDELAGDVGEVDLSEPEPSRTSSSDVGSRRHPRAQSPAKGAGVGYSFVKSSKKS